MRNIKIVIGVVVVALMVTGGVVYYSRHTIPSRCVLKSTHETKPVFKHSSNLGALVQSQAFIEIAGEKLPAERFMSLDLSGVELKDTKTKDVRTMSLDFSGCGEMEFTVDNSGAATKLAASGTWALRYKGTELSCEAKFDKSWAKDEYYICDKPTKIECKSKDKKVADINFDRILVEIDGNTEKVKNDEPSKKPHAVC